MRAASANATHATRADDLVGAVVLEGDDAILAMTEKTE